MSRPRVPWILSGVVLALAGGLAPPAHATKVLERNLEEMARLSERAFVGTCLEEAYEEPIVDGVRLRCTRYTFRVLDSIKGDLGETVVFRQFGRVEGTLRIPGMPVYREGSKYVLFLLPESRIGLTSPVGLMQGALSVSTVEGDEVVLNAVDNRGLLDEVTRGRLGLNHAEARVAGPLRLDDFVAMARELVEREGGR